MTGTALTEATEFMKIYEIAGGRDPDPPADGPRRPQRPDLQDQGRQVEGGRRRDQGAPRGGPADARRHDLGRGLGDARRASSSAPGSTHAVLNAKPEHAQREGETVAQAGRLGAVTIATNMAGRGVDIKLGGDPEMLADRRAAKARPQARRRELGRGARPSMPSASRSRPRPRARRCASSAASSSAAPSATSRGGSTTSFAAAPAARATPASRASSSPPRTT